jgi:Fe-S cluster biogenesis protein NfuA
MRPVTRRFLLTTSLVLPALRPAGAQDGGDILFHKYEDGIVYLTMQGSCSGCPSSTATLKMGIENMLRHYIPEIVEVRAVA